MQNKLEENKFNGLLKLILLVFIINGSALVAHAETFGKWEVYEVNLTTSNTYANSYTDVWVYANFTSPGGNQITINGFWDGGNNWKIRMAPTEVGTWNYITQSNDAQLNGKTGSFTVTESGKKGFIVRDPINGFAFKRSDGGNVLLMGDTNWNIFSNVGGILSYNIFTQYIDDRSAQNFNFIRGYIVPFYATSTDSQHYNEGGRSFEPWNPDNLNPKYFQEIDKRIKYANSKGIMMHLLVGADGTVLTTFFGWGNGKMERYIKYMAARYSAYDIEWEGRAEFEEQGGTTPGHVALANQIGNWIQKYDPYGHLQSMHTLNSNNELGNEAWLDWIMQQSRNWDSIISDRSYNKPVINEEFYYENSGAGATHTHHVDADTVRKGAWNVMTYGSSGLAFGNTGTYNSRSKSFAGIQYAQSPGANYMTYLYNFWNSTKYWRLTPNNNLIQSGTASAIADIGNDYVIYLPSGGSTTVNLASASGTLTVEWYNPRTGIYHGQTTVQGGASRTFTAPDTNDWVLHITTSGNVDLTALGNKILAGNGDDPDIAVAFDGTAHIVYVRSGTVYYKKGVLASGFGSEINIGTGVDPRIDLDISGNPHIVLGSAYIGGNTISYSKWTGSDFSAPQIVLSGGTFRKPRIEVDSDGNAVISVEDRSQIQRISYVRISSNGVVSSQTIVGDDNNGGIGIDGTNRYHFTWRLNNIYYVNSSGPGNKGSSVQITPPASDFSELDINLADNSVYVIAVVANAGGIYYTTNAGGVWKAAQKYAVTELIGAVTDDVNPSIAVDSLGRSYITFNGVGQVPHYFVVDQTGVASAILKLDAGTSGGKYMNPNIEEAPGGGAYVAYGSGGSVYVNTIGISSGAVTQDTLPPKITSLTLTDPTELSLVYSESVEQSSSTSTSNYAIDNGITISSASLGTDLRTVTLTTSTHVGGNNYTLTVNNVKDIAKIPNTILSNTKISYQYTTEFIINNISTASGRIYSIEALATGKLQYIDRTFTFSSLPPGFIDMKFIRTANDDKAFSATSFLEFDVNRDVTVYVAHDDRIVTKPTWLSSFVDTGENLVSGGGTFSLYTMNFSAGHIILGGNGNSVGSSSMYTVVLRPFDSIIYSKSDVNLDGKVNIDDLINILLDFNKYTTPPYPRSDINEDGIVDILDIRIVSREI